MKRFGLLAMMLATLLFGRSFAQEAEETSAPDNRQITLPEVGVNFGIVTLMSDVALSSPGPNPFTQFGYQVTVTQQVVKSLNLSLNIFTGTVYGEEMRNLTNLNYRTALFSQQLNLEYNFYPLLKPDAQGRQLLRPYIGIGVGAMFFRSKGDLRDANGDTYNYWSDGSMRSLSESDPNAEAAVLLQRDMVYESDLRDANMDGLRKYPQATFTLPFHAGIRIQVSKNFGVNAAFTYAMNFSDMLDNSGAQSVGDRVSSSGNDHHIFGSIGVNVFFGKIRPSAKRPEAPEQLAQSVNRWKTKENDDGKLDLAESSEKSSTKKATPNLKDARGGADSSDVTVLQPQMAYRADGTPVELTPTEIVGADGTPLHLLFDAQGVALTPSMAANALLAYKKDGTAVPLVANSGNGVDGTPQSQLFDAVGRPLTEAVPTSLGNGFRADGSKVSLVATGYEGADGTPVEQLSDAKGNKLTTETAAVSTLAFRADGTVVEVVPKGFVGSDGTPLERLTDATGRRIEAVEVPRRLAYTAEGRPVEITSGIPKAKDGTLAVQLFDANGNAFADSPIASARLAYRADGRPVELAPNETKGVEGTPANRLFDANGQAIEAKTGSGKRLAYRADGTAVEIVPNGFEGADGTPIGQLLDAQRQPMTSEKAATALLAYRQDGSAVEIVPESMVGVDGTSSEQLFYAQGNALASDVVQNRVAYKADGSPVAVSYTGMSGADGTPVDQLFDAKGNKLTVETASPSRLAYRADGKPVEVIATGVLVVDGTAKEVLFDAQGRALDILGITGSEALTAADVLPNAAKDEVKPKPDSKKDRRPEKSDSQTDRLTLEELEKSPPKLSGKFHWADRDRNGYISADEVLFCIDQLFEGGGDLTVESIQDLIDYYFDQD
ncbi:MAG: EF-hand domain-containing protein [Flavobacteriales bacterium]|nr:EF-hand domain-containing protein [Flavobacteriales bacterium]